MNVAKKLRPISEKKRNDIINEAGKLFLKYGFGAVSMDEVSQKAKVSKRTLYNHFPNKKVLFSEIIKLEWYKIRYPRVSDMREEDPEVMFTKIIKHVLEIMYSKKMMDLIRVIVMEAKKFPELKEMQSEHGLEPQFNDFTRYVEYLNKKGILKVDNPRIAVAQYIGLIKECIYWPYFFGFIAKPTEKEQDDVIQRANKMFFGYYRVK